jgi:hypothetical protein
VPASPPPTTRLQTGHPSHARGPRRASRCATVRARPSALAALRDQTRLGLPAGQLSPGAGASCKGDPEAWDDVRSGCGSGSGPGTGSGTGSGRGSTTFMRASRSLVTASRLGLPVYASADTRGARTGERQASSCCSRRQQPSPRDTPTVDRAIDGTRKSQGRARIVANAVEKPNEYLEKGEGRAIPTAPTLRSPRRTYASILFAIGATPPYVAAQLGHTAPKHIAALRAGHRSSRRRAERLRSLVDGDVTAATRCNEPVETAGSPEMAVSCLHRGVAQPGSALALGARGRRFKSDRPDILIYAQLQAFHR